MEVDCDQNCNFITDRYSDQATLHVVVSKSRVVNAIYSTGLCFYYSKIL